MLRQRHEPILSYHLQRKRLGGSIKRLSKQASASELARIIGETVKAPKFSYTRGESLDQVLMLLNEYGEEGRILAGGQSLMPTLNMRLSNPKILIDINHLSELNSISLNDDIVCIGALSRHSEVGRSPIVERHLPLIADAIPHVAHIAVRNRGTFGGSVALADPAAELPACVLALGGTLVLQSVRGIRKIIADEYFLGLYETERKPDELLIEVQIPVQDPSALSAFVELSQRKGDYAIAGLAFVGTLENQLIKSAKLVYFGSEIKPTLAKNTMAVLTNTPWDDKTRELIAETLGQDLDPMTNLQGSAKMKLHLQKVLTGRAIDLALEKAQAPR